MAFRRFRRYELYNATPLTRSFLVLGRRQLMRSHDILHEEKSTGMRKNQPVFRHQVANRFNNPSRGMLPLQANYVLKFRHKSGFSEAKVFLLQRKMVSFGAAGEWIRYPNSFPIFRGTELFCGVYLFGRRIYLKLRCLFDWKSRMGYQLILYV